MPNDLRVVFKVRHGSQLCLRVQWRVGGDGREEEFVNTFGISRHGLEPKGCVVYFGFLTTFL